MIKPIYEQVFLDIQEKIKSGFYKEFDYLPSVSELQELYDTSQITIRRALLELKGVGAIEMSRGKKARIIPTRETRSLKGIYGTSEEISMQGAESSSPVLVFEDSHIPPSWISELTEKESVYYLKRLRKRNDQIIGVTEQYIVKHHGFEIALEQLGDKVSIYEAYQKQGFTIKYTDEMIECELAGDDNSRVLNIDKSMPLFKRTRTTYDNSERVLEVSINYFRADMYQYFVRIEY